MMRFYVVEQQIFLKAYACKIWVHYISCTQRPPSLVASIFGLICRLDKLDSIGSISMWCGEVQTYDPPPNKALIPC